MKQLERLTYPLQGVPDTLRKATEFDLNTLYNLAFGGRGLPLYVKPAKLQSVGAERLTLGPLQINEEGSPYEVAKRNTGMSLENAPLKSGNIFLPLYYWVGGNAPDEATKNLFPVCTVEASVNKVIVKTPLVGKEGSVKELIRSEDVVFSIRGLCIGYKGEYPEKQINAMIDLYKNNEAIEISHAMVNKFYGGIMRVVIEKLHFPETKGTSHVVPFEMEMVSDNILELKIN